MYAVAYRATVRGERFQFPDLRQLLACANEEKSGDQLAGLAARSGRERVAARLALADVTVGELVADPLIDDAVTGLNLDGLDRDGLAQITSLTCGELRELVLGRDFPLHWTPAAISPEVAAAIAKLMGDKDLILAASRLHRVTRCRNTMGEPGVFGVRVQPNHPSDDIEGVLWSTLDGAASRLRRRGDRSEPGRGVRGCARSGAARRRLGMT